MMGENKYSAELAKSHWWWKARGHTLRKLAEKHVRPRMRLPRRELNLIDIGCGTGVSLPLLGQYGYARGYDISPEAVALCPMHVWKCDAVVADCYALPEEPASIDVAVSMDMLEHLKDDIGALREMYRVLMPGGILIISVPAMPSLWSQHDVTLGHYRRYDLKELEALVEAVGFYPLESRHIMGSLYPAAWLQRRLSRNPSNGTPEGFRLPGWINRTVELALNLETDCTKLPFGSSVFLVAMK